MKHADGQGASIPGEVGVRDGDNHAARFPTIAPRSPVEEGLELHHSLPKLAELLGGLPPLSVKRVA